MWVPWRGRGPVRVNRTESWRDIAVQRADVSNSKHWSAKGPGARARGGVIEFSDRILTRVGSVAIHHTTSLVLYYNTTLLAEKDREF